ncbi:iron exporter MbfA [Limoniibacter endophyticus]|uniref:Membrane protein n=1 Tax=Limoniibacter endophyticus TaxID=1565040 RepID=A0A8J3DHB9_9HYPH|nr:ferritin family protein [Limoniibacter endophyticus]GHC67016.1 membrane protein [Limoniibacter endophyticus]
MLSFLRRNHKRTLDSLSEAEILALAISSEEDDARIYRAYADGLRDDFPASATVFEEMAQEEDEHRSQLIALFEQRCGNVIPLIRRDHVHGFPERRPDWLVKPFGLEAVRNQAEAMERQAERFYLAAAKRSQDPAIRDLLGTLAAAESNHQTLARDLADKHLPMEIAEEEIGKERRQFILTYVQPGLAGLMDGSVSTLAPIFAAAFATQDTWQTFLVGLAASVGAGISMGFTEVASDDGRLSGRGSPVKRGLATGIMTTVGGLGHTLPYLIPHFNTATAIAFAIVFVELWVIAYIQNRYMETPFWRATLQIVLGGGLVLAAGMLIGSA